MGLAWPVPHSESVKVLVPKWKKRAMPSSCHWSWKVVGRGKIGRGGGFREQDAGTKKQQRHRRRIRIRKLGSVQVEILIPGLWDLQDNLKLLLFSFMLVG